MQPGARFCGAPDDELRVSFMTRYREALAPAQLKSGPWKGSVPRVRLKLVAKVSFTVGSPSLAWGGGELGYEHR